MEGIKSNTSYNKTCYGIKDLDSEFYIDSKSSRYNYTQSKYYSLRPNFKYKKIFQSTQNNPTSFNKNFLDRIINSKSNRNDLFSMDKNNNKYISVKNFSIARKFYPSYLKKRIINEFKTDNKNLTSATSTTDFKNSKSNSEKSKITKKFKSGQKKPKTFLKKNMSTERNNELSSTDKNLSYYYPNLFNISHNKIKNINSLMKNDFSVSRFFFNRINGSNYDNEIRRFKVTIKPKAIANTDENNNKEENKMFTEKIYNIDVLKNVRFNFKDSIERSKYKDFLNSFNTTRNIKINKV